LCGKNEPERVDDLVAPCEFIHREIHSGVSLTPSLL
jgi:hypothetical protein